MRAFAASDTDPGAASSVPTLPVDPVEMVDQAAATLERAMAEGVFRHRIDLLLPINEKEFDFGATESIDYPCSLMKEYETAINLTKLLFRKLLGDDAGLTIRRVDEGGVEGEPCGVVTNAADTLAAVVYPTANILPQIRKLAEKEGRALLIVNPQWRESGQIVSDFGIGPWKKAAYDFLDTFEPSYVLVEKRIGAPGSVDISSGARFGSGGVLRYLRRFPGEYQVFAMAADGSSQQIAVSEGMPDYRESEAMIARGREAKLEIFERAQEVSKGGEAEAPEAAAAEEVAAAGGAELSEAAIDAMDAVMIRRALISRGLPSSGKLAALRKRLKEAACKQG